VSHVIYAIPNWHLQIEGEDTFRSHDEPTSTPNNSQIWIFIFVRKEIFLLLFFFFYLLQAWCDHLGYGVGWMRSKGKNENENLKIVFKCYKRIKKVIEELKH